MSNTPAVYGYHAHVYYDAATLPVAEKLKEEAQVAVRCRVGAQ
jgi:aromatic ring-cleaving dioxygenase